MASSWGKSFGLSWGNSWGKTQEIEQHTQQQGIGWATKKKKIVDDDNMCLDIMLRCFLEIQGNRY